MRLESYRRARPTINLSALVDVLFILIVFVVLAANFDRAGAERFQAVHIDTIELPAGGSGAVPEVESAVLQVPLSGPLVLDGVAVRPDRLAEHLARARARHDSLTLLADGQLPLTRATELLGAATRAGFDSVAIITREAPREDPREHLEPP